MCKHLRWGQKWSSHQSKQQSLVEVNALGINKHSTILNSLFTLMLNICVSKTETTYSFFKLDNCARKVNLNINGGFVQKKNSITTDGIFFTCQCFALDEKKKKSITQQVMCKVKWCKRTKKKKRVDEIKLISADSTVHSPSLNLLSSNTASLFLFFGFFC